MGRKAGLALNLSAIKKCGNPKFGIDHKRSLGYKAILAGD
jgi:hypothetical protein